MSRFPQRLLRIILSGILSCLTTGSASAMGPIDLKKVKTDRVVYHKVGRLELYMDLYLPEEDAARQRRPAVVWFHGGSWRSGTPRQFKPQSQYLAANGLVCASVRYRLSRESKFPACLNDAKCAVRFLRAHAKRYGIDPDRIAVGGGSAGGHLACSKVTAPMRTARAGPIC